MPKFFESDLSFGEIKEEFRHSEYNLLDQRKLSSKLKE